MMVTAISRCLMMLIKLWLVVDNDVGQLLVNTLKFIQLFRRLLSLTILSVLHILKALSPSYA